jgi:tRNA(His) 5'-end guanylyltransferase
LKALEGAADPPPVAAQDVLYARLDGRAFSTLTRGLAKPRCAAFAAATASVAEAMLRRTGAQAAHPQSDEISLLWTPPPAGGAHPFGGRILKIASILAGEASALLQARLRDDRSPLASRIPHFDARVLGLSRDYAAAMVG